MKENWKKVRLLNMINHKGKNNPNFKDGRTLEKYYCIDCGKEIGINSALYGQGRCRSCAHKEKRNPNFGKIWQRNFGIKNPMFGKKAKNSKGNYYKNIYMRSSYEIAFAKWLNKNNIEYQYEPKTFDLYNSTYTPDFYLPEKNLWIEIKGFWWKDAKEKFKLFNKLYPKRKIKILMQEDLQELGVL